MATVIFIGGVQIFSIGLIGEYLGRTYLKLNGKPQFVIRTTTQNEVSKK
jgi:undecaprenyl-phosphate 4-deoxy-4-formamido-L-arabinose transferase